MNNIEARVRLLGIEAKVAIAKGWFFGRGRGRDGDGDGIFNEGHNKGGDEGFTDADRKMAHLDNAFFTPRPGTPEAQVTGASYAIGAALRGPFEELMNSADGVTFSKVGGTYHVNAPRYVQARLKHWIYK